MDEKNEQQPQDFQPPPPPPPPAPSPEPAAEISAGPAAFPSEQPAALGTLALRMDRAEALIVDLQGRLAGAPAAEISAVPAEPPAVPPAAGQLAGLEAAVDGLKRAVSREEELAARLERAEADLAGLRSAVEGQRSHVETELDLTARRDSVEALRVNVAAALSSAEEMKLLFAQYSEEISAARSECRKALGEAQGFAKAAAVGGAQGKLDAFVKDTLARLGARMAELETAMHAGLSELSARFSANEVVYGKMFSAAEERLGKAFEPKLKDIEGQLRWLRESVIRLSDDYTVVAERKMKALEAKYSAFEAISRRMDAIDAALKMGGRIGLL